MERRCVGVTLMHRHWALATFGDQPRMCGGGGRDPGGELGGGGRDFLEGGVTSGHRGGIDRGAGGGIMVGVGVADRQADNDAGRSPSVPPLFFMTNLAP